MFLWQEKMLQQIEITIHTEKDIDTLKVLKKKLEHFLHFDRTLGNPEHKEYQEKLLYFIDELNCKSAF